MADGKLTQKPSLRSAWLGVLAFIITFALAAAVWYNNPILPILHHPAKDCMATDSSQGMVSVVFSEHYEYQNLSHAHDHLWDNLLTPNGGFVRATDNNQTKHDYGISMYHQLHCLQMIRSAIQGLQSQAGGGSAAEHDHTNMPHAQARNQDSHMHPDSEHWLHCLDYLRQTILCSADGTIEPPKMRPSGEEVINGMGERKCRDWTPLRDLSLQKDVLAESLPARVQ